MNKIVKFVPPSIAVINYPDSERYRGGFAVRSESSNNLYKISFDIAPGAMYWTCSCVGNISHGSCKHLETLGLRGRKYGKQIQEAKKYGWLK